MQSTLLKDQTCFGLWYTWEKFHIRYWCFLSPTAPVLPTLKALVNELNSVSDWYSLGINLDLKRHQISEIERNHRGDEKRCKTEILGCWLDNCAEPTWAAVAEALDLMEVHTVAEKIRHKYISSTTTTQGIAFLYIKGL